MNDIILSFCITTFQRYEILEELVLSILSVNNKRFEVVVCDDCSMDGSINKIRNISDERLKIYVNSRRLGALQNMYEALEHGMGKYLFFINDRDNVDSFKINKLISILEEFDKQNIAFARCIDETFLVPEYKVFSKGEYALLEFACRIVHPTGYIFRRDVWEKIKNRKKYFYKEYYGDYPITMICAIMAVKYNGAYIYGDICEVSNERIDFAKEKSRYHWKRKDKRMWYSPGVQWRELAISYFFLKEIHVGDELIDNILSLRYDEYSQRIILHYKEIVSRVSDTIHYGINLKSNIASIFITSIRNGIYLWFKMKKFCCCNKKYKLLYEINKYTIKNFIAFSKIMQREILERL